MAFRYATLNMHVLQTLY